MKKYMVDHVCLSVKDLDAAIRFYTEVFGMSVFQTVGEKPARKIWLDGGIQLAEVTDVASGCGVDHFALNVPEAEHEAICARAADYGCVLTEGKKLYQWLTLPDGQILELTDITQQHNK